MAPSSYCQERGLSLRRSGIACYLGRMSMAGVRAFRAGTIQLCSVSSAEREQDPGVEVPEVPRVVQSLLTGRGGECDTSMRIHWHEGRDTREKGGGEDTDTRGQKEA